MAWFHQLRSNMVQNHHGSLVATASPSLLPLLRHLSNSCAMAATFGHIAAGIWGPLSMDSMDQGLVCAATDLQSKSTFLQPRAVKKLAVQVSIPNIVAKLAANQSPEIGRVWVDQWWSSRQKLRTRSGRARRQWSEASHQKDHLLKLPCSLHHRHGKPSMSPALHRAWHGVDTSSRFVIMVCLKFWHATSPRGLSWILSAYHQNYNTLTSLGAQQHNPCLDNVNPGSVKAPSFIQFVISLVVTGLVIK